MGANSDYSVVFCVQSAAYEMRMSDFSSGVCASDRSWNELAGFSGLSEFSSAQLLLPALEPLVLKTAKIDDPVVLLDDGKQASQTLIRINPKIAPGRLVARLDIDSDQRLYGTVAAGPAAGLLKLQFPSLADTGLKPDKDKSKIGRAHV